MTEPTLFDHLLALLFGVLVPIGAARQSRTLAGVEFDSRARVAAAYGFAVQLWVFAALVLGAWWWADRPLGALGLRAAELDAWTSAALLAVVLGFVADGGWKLRSPAARERTRRRWLRDTPFLPRTRAEAGHFVVLAVSAGICEELVFRGFLISYAGWFTTDTVAGRIAAVALPAISFATAHAYQGARAVAVILLMGCAFGTVFVHSGSLWWPMAVHAALDAAAVAVGVALVRARGSDSADADASG